jgi:hypothetical protein
MSIADAQADIRRAYVGGGPGILVSACVWCAAGLVEQTKGASDGFLALFFGGMLIFPLSILIARLIFRRAGESKSNPLSATALESTIVMIGGLFAAWLFLPFHAAYVFPLAAIAVGTHYAVFKTVYGERLLWLLGALITAVGLIDILARPIPGGVIFAVAGLEAVFGLVQIIRHGKAK